MKAIQDNLQSMINKYEERIEKINRQKTLMLFISIPLLIIVGTYLSFSYIQFRKLTSPINLVGIGYDSAMGALPQTMASVETYIIESAPEVVDNAFDSVINQLPLTRRSAQQRMDLLIDQALHTMEQFFTVALKSVVGSYREEILSITDVRDKEQVDILAARVENDLRAHFDAQANETIDKFATVLENIDEELGILVKTHPAYLTHEQLLERRFLELWVHIVKERFPEE